MPRSCQKCSGPALTISELNERSKTMGMYVRSDGTIIAPASHRAEADALESLKGFQCSRCAAVYCLDCILLFAPPHANGGKACFQCRSPYQILPE